MRKKLIVLAAGAGLSGLLLVAFLCHHASTPAEDHIRALAKLRYPPNISSFGGYFSSDYLLWNLQGRLNDSQVNKRKDEHRDGLVALGYLQRRTFKLEHRKLEDGVQLQQLQLLHRTLCAANGLGAPLVAWSTDWSNMVTVTARPSEVKVFEEVLRGIDLTNTPPNPQSRANGRQPFGSETNRTPAAAASRRSP